VKKFLLFLFIFLTMALRVNAEPVVYNTNTQKVHKTHCQHAKKCTVNCIKIERQDAYKRGGKPCKVCGG
jgi:ADP-glucose pyrophosphorylase